MDCKYHDNKKALWHCEECNIPFCMDCVEVEAGVSAPRCVLCRRYLASYGVSGHVEPFWNRLNNFYQYPLQKAAKSFLLFYAIASLLIGFLIDFIPIGFIDLILRLALMAILVSYVFSVLNKTAKGDFKAPTYDQTVTYDGDGMTVKVIGLFVLLFLGGVAVTSKFSYTGLYLYQLFVAFIIPAVLVTLGMTKHLSSSLNPLNIMQTIAGIGFPYLILFGLVAVISYSLSWATFFINYWLPDPVVFLMSQTATAFFYIMLFHILGYVVYQYHAELGYGVDIEVLAANEESLLTPEERAMAHAEIYIQEGRYQDAKDKLLEAGQSLAFQEVAYRKLVKLNLAKQDRAGAIKAASLYFNNPELEKHGFQAFQLYQEIKKTEARFRPMNANARAVLIGQVRHKNQADEVAWLTQDLTEKFVLDADLPQALLAQAKYYAEIEHDDLKASEVLKPLLAAHPQGKHRLEAEQLLKVCQAVLA